MQPWHTWKDKLRIVRACASNQLARFLPGVYRRLAPETGRGVGKQEPREIAAYYHRCFLDYVGQFGKTEEEFGRFIRGKRVLEYGPGDTLAVALLFLAYGAGSVCCVDRFPLGRLSDVTADTYRATLDLLDENRRARASRAFRIVGDPASGFEPGRISYRIHPEGLSLAQTDFDLIVSRAVLEHVANLEKTFQDIRSALKPGGVSVHKVDLGSHGMDRHTELDFLSWPSWLYDLMYSHKGYPNRWRVDKYREAIHKAGLRCTKLEPTKLIDLKSIERIRPHLAGPFKSISDSDLGWLGFWMSIER
jgi:SAM-dependent methyltransferase